jgi:hypothetical protein
MYHGFLTIRSVRLLGRLHSRLCCSQAVSLFFDLPHAVKQAAKWKTRVPAIFLVSKEIGRYRLF